MHQQQQQQQQRTTTTTALEAESSDRQKQQEYMMEELSRIGADKIAALGVAERTKRALLAEAIEDRIFDLTEQLDQLIVDSKIPVENREKAVQLAQQTKVLQTQYQELVSGEPSSLLGSLESVTKSSDNNEDGEEK